MKCEFFKIKKVENTVTEEEKNSYEEHIQTKTQAQMERNRDRENKTPTFSFDLENVITCPRCEVGDFFLFTETEYL